MRNVIITKWIVETVLTAIVRVLQAGFFAMGFSVAARIALQTSFMQILVWVWTGIIGINLAIGVWKLIKKMWYNDY